jgi:internalin A
MAADENKGYPKPPEILAIEEAYGVELLLGNYDHIILFLDEVFCLYSLSEDGHVNGLSIHGKTVYDITPINILKNLKVLSLFNTAVNDITGLTPNSSLEYLYLANNLIFDFRHLQNMPNISELALGRVHSINIDNLPYLSNLEIFHCWDSGLVDLSFIKKFPNLKKLYVSNNKISNVNELAEYKSLEKVDLAKNCIREIPKDVAVNFNWLDYSIADQLIGEFAFIELQNNPLQFPPTSVIQLGKGTIRNYYKSAEQFGHAPLSEGRIIVIGDGSAGKSSVIDRVLYNGFEEHRNQTHGIKIEHWQLSHPEDGRALNFHIWDFGGQEIQHAVHKFFFTEGCLYILVLDSRKEEEPEYWLQQIESLGGKAPVLVVFNKQDQHPVESADRKFLKEKYPNIVGFYNTSCLNGMGIPDFKAALEKEVVQLKTVDEQFPNNWLDIKKAIETYTSGQQHYLTYETYLEICKQNHLKDEAAQKLLLRYFNTIGAVTWFGEDTYLKFLHVLKPEWITQGVYKILTAEKTARLFGQIRVSDFKELLQPVNTGDYTYDEAHYGYILSMMKKFNLCYTPDDQQLLIPSAFGKMPKVEYSDFKGEGVRTYILQFKEYMPLALIHRFTAQKLGLALDNNYWYTGIVIKDNMSDALAMVHADKDAKRIYVRIKGGDALGVWGQVRRDLAAIAGSYAKIPYEEEVALPKGEENLVKYTDLVSHVQANRQQYFHPGLREEFNVGYLMGLFEPKEGTLEKIEKGEISITAFKTVGEKVPPVVLNILNNNSPTVNTQVNTQINIDIDLQLVHNQASEIKGEATYLLEALGDSNKALAEALQKAIQFADDAKAARNSGEVKEKGWGRKIKNVLETLGSAGEQLKKIQDGGEVAKAIVGGIQKLMEHIF